MILAVTPAPPRFFHVRHGDVTADVRADSQAVAHVILAAVVALLVPTAQGGIYTWAKRVDKYAYYDTLEIVHLPDEVGIATSATMFALRDRPEIALRQHVFPGAQTWLSRTRSTDWLDRPVSW